MVSCRPDCRFTQYLSLGGLLIPETPIPPVSYPLATPVPETRPEKWTFLKKVCNPGAAAPQNGWIYWPTMVDIYAIYLQMRVRISVYLSYG